MKQNSSSRTKNSIRNAMWGLITKVVSLSFTFLSRTYIIHTIGAAYVGVGGLFTSILTILNMSELGFSSAIVYLMYKPLSENDTDKINSLLELIKRIYWIVTGMITFAGLCFVPLLDIIVKNDTGVEINLKLLYFIYLFDIVSSYIGIAYRGTLFTAHQRQDVISKIECLFMVVRCAVQLAVLVGTQNYYLYILTMACFVLPKNFVIYLYSQKKYPQFKCSSVVDKVQLGMALQKVKSIFGHRLGGTFIISIDGLVISSILGLQVLAKYENYYYIYNSIVAFLTVVRTSMTASIGNKLCVDSMDNVYELYKKLTFIWISVITFCTVSLLAFFQPFMHLWVGEKLMLTDRAVITIAVYFFCWQFRKINETMHSAGGLWEYDKWKPYIGIILNLGLSILLVKITGNIEGVLIPTIFIMIFIFCPWEIYILFKYLFKRGCRDYILLLLKSIIPAAVVCTVDYVLSGSILQQGITGLIVRAVVCILPLMLLYFILCRNLPQMKAVRGDLYKTLKILKKS